MSVFLPSGFWVRALCWTYWPAGKLKVNCKKVGNVTKESTCPLVVAYGLGVNSTAMLIEFANRGIHPDLILFADTGGEKPETYQYLKVIQPFLKRVGFPRVIVVRYRP